MHPQLLVAPPVAQRGELKGKSLMKYTKEILIGKKFKTQSGNYYKFTDKSLSETHVEVESLSGGAGGYHDLGVINGHLKSGKWAIMTDEELEAEHKELLSRWVVHWDSKKDFTKSLESWADDNKNTALAVSILYDFEKATRHHNLNNRIVKVVPDPRSSMVAELLKHYEELFVKNNIFFEVRSTKKQCLVDATISYQKKYSEKKFNKKKEDTVDKLKIGDWVVLAEGATQNDHYVKSNCMDYVSKYRIVGTLADGFYMYVETFKGKRLAHSCYAESLIKTESPKNKIDVNKKLKLVMTTHDHPWIKSNLSTSVQLSRLPKIGISLESTGVDEGTRSLEGKNFQMVGFKGIPYVFPLECFVLEEDYKKEEKEERDCCADLVGLIFKTSIGEIYHINDCTSPGMKMIYSDGSTTGGGCWKNEDIEKMLKGSWIIMKNHSVDSEGNITCDVEAGESIVDVSEGAVLNGSQVDCTYLGSDTYFLECVKTNLPWYTKGNTYVFKAGALIDDDGDIRRTFSGKTEFKILTVHSGEVQAGTSIGAESITESPAVSYAKKLYKVYKDVGWSEEDLKDIHTKTVKEYMDVDGVKDLRPEAIRNLIWYMATCKEETTEPKDGLNKQIINTKKEYNNMSKTTNNIVISVSTAAYAETTTISSYGEEVRKDDEAGLMRLIAKIDSEQETLKAANKNAKSKRIIGQINKLGAARTKITALLDALPEDSDVS